MEWSIDAETCSVKIELQYDIFVVQTISPLNSTVAQFRFTTKFYCRQLGDPQIILWHPAIFLISVGDWANVSLYPYCNKL